MENREAQRAALWSALRSMLAGLPPTYPFFLPPPRSSSDHHPLSLQGQLCALLGIAAGCGSATASLRRAAAQTAGIQPAIAATMSPAAIIRAVLGAEAAADVADHPQAALQQLLLDYHFRHSTIVSLEEVRAGHLGDDDSDMDMFDATIRCFGRGEKTVRTAPTGGDEAHAGPTVGLMLSPLSQLAYLVRTEATRAGAPVAPQPIAALLRALTGKASTSTTFEAYVKALDAAGPNQERQVQAALATIGSSGVALLHEREDIASSLSGAADMDGAPHSSASPSSIPVDPSTLFLLPPTFLLHSGGASNAQNAAARGLYGGQLDRTRGAVALVAQVDLLDVEVLRLWAVAPTAAFGGAADALSEAAARALTPPVAVGELQAHYTRWLCEHGCRNARQVGLVAAEQIAGDRLSLCAAAQAWSLTGMSAATFTTRLTVDKDTLLPVPSRLMVEQKVADAPLVAEHVHVWLLGVDDDSAPSSDMVKLTACGTVTPDNITTVLEAAKKAAAAGPLNMPPMTPRFGGGGTPGSTMMPPVTPRFGGSHGGAGSPGSLPPPTPRVGGAFGAPPEDAATEDLLRILEDCHVRLVMHLEQQLLSHHRARDVWLRGLRVTVPLSAPSVEFRHHVLPPRPTFTREEA